MYSRRKFIRNSVLGATALGLYPLKSFSLNTSDSDIQITILHTNDMHSHIEPFLSGRNKGLGGMAQRSSIINKIRDEGNSVLLLDAGDIFQGTPYFNIYGGELEFKLMSKLGYDAATLGNHDFDNGIEKLTEQLPNASFPFIVSNYDFTETKMIDKVLKYKVFIKEGVRIGVFGIGIELNGLVPKKLYGETKYLDPIEVSNYYSNFLRSDKKCDLIICLSHLGYKYPNNKVSDIMLASKTRGIDLIIGGHTHTFLNDPVYVKDLDQNNVQIAQVGYGGINIGRIDYFFTQKLRLKKINSKAIYVK